MPKFIDEIKYYDPELHQAVTALADLSMAPGALDGKTKTLITLALDALAGAKKGVEVLAKQARKLGATDQEIAEALRLAYFVAGNKVLAIADEAFEEDDDDYKKDDYKKNKDEDEEEFEEDEQVNQEASGDTETEKNETEDEYDIQEYTIS